MSEEQVLQIKGNPTNCATREWVTGDGTKSTFVRLIFPDSMVVLTDGLVTDLLGSGLKLTYNSSRIFVNTGESLEFARASIDPYSIRSMTGHRHYEPPARDRPPYFQPDDSVWKVVDMNIGATKPIIVLFGTGQGKPSRLSAIQVSTGNFRDIPTMLKIQDHLMRI